MEEVRNSAQGGESFGQGRAYSTVSPALVGGPRMPHTALSLVSGLQTPSRPCWQQNMAQEGWGVPGDNERGLGSKLTPHTDWGSGKALVPPPPWACSEYQLG